MSAPLVLAIPSKGRLMEQTAQAFAAAGLVIRKAGHERGYRGLIEGRPGVEVAYLSASEIAREVGAGNAHLGITGLDLVHENVPQWEERVEIVRPLGFGHADVVVAVPDCWIDVEEVSDLEAVSVTFRHIHGRRPRIATKYVNITRRFLAQHGVSGFLIVESLGATEGTPAAGTAEAIVDITTTGSTLRANRLKVLSDGVILPSQAHLILSRTAPLGTEATAALGAMLRALGA